MSSCGLRQAARMVAPCGAVDGGEGGSWSRASSRGRPPGYSWREFSRDRRTQGGSRGTRPRGSGCRARSLSSCFGTPGSAHARTPWCWRMGRWTRFWRAMSRSETPRCGRCMSSPPETGWSWAGWRPWAGWSRPGSGRGSPGSSRGRSGRSRCGLRCGGRSSSARVAGPSFARIPAWSASRPSRSPCSGGSWGGVLPG